MSGDELIVIFHYEGDLEFDMIHPLYKGGKQKMRSIRSDITFESLVKVANETSHWEGNREDISIYYLHHNGKVFSLVVIEDDNDIKCMLTLSRVETNGICLYINRTPIGSSLRIEEPRSHGLNMCLLRDEKCAGTASNHDAKRKAPYARDIRCSTVNLSEDDMHFSSKPNIARDKLAQESDIVFRKYLDAVESDDEVEIINIKVDRPGSSTHAGACLRVTVNAKSNVREPSTHWCEVIVEDNMVPEEFPTDLYHNTSREMWLAREFPDQENFRGTIAKFTIYNNFALQHLKASQFKVTTHYKDRDCLWRIHTSIVESGPRFKVRTYNPVHKCSKPMMGTAHKQASSKLFAEYILDKVHLNNNLRPKEIINDYQMEFGVTISYKKAHISREMALHIVRGSYEDSFKLIPLYCAVLKMMNPGSVTNIKTSDDDRFRRFFWAFAPFIHALTLSLRPMIAVDGSHLRGKYHAVLLVAVTLDANHKLFPIAFAFAEAERRDSWEWFIANVSLALGEPMNLTIISDRQKRLVPTLANVMPTPTHCYCCHHLAENIKSRFNDSVIVMKFWCAAKAYRACQHDAFMEDIKAVNIEAYNYIHAFGRQHWKNDFVEGRRYDMLTSNAAEYTKSMLKDTRVLPIVKQVEEIRVKLMEFFQKRQIGSLAIKTRLTPYAKKQLSHETEEPCRLHMRVAGLEEFQVQSASFLDAVHLDHQTCTCRKWQINGTPFSRAIAGMRLSRKNPYDFCDEWYLASKFQSTYKEDIHAIRDSSSGSTYQMKGCCLLYHQNSLEDRRKTESIQKTTIDSVGLSLALTIMNEVTIGPHAETHPLRIIHRYLF